ncbi:MAG: rRNA synthase [Actinomycetota bacterium]|nr:rRNA synthase [Actinomycetota bacterium]
MKETVPAALAGERVDRVVAMLTGLPRAEIAELVHAGAVRVGGEPVRARSQRLDEGDELEVDVPARAAPGLVPDPDVPVPVVHLDTHVAVIDKPAGLVVHPGAGNQQATLAHGLLARFPQLVDGPGDPGRPGIVHRLDKGTSGLLAVALTDVAYASLVAQLQAHTVDRRYTALVWGHVEADAGMVDAPVGRSGRDPTRMSVSRRGREARTRYKVEARFDDPAPLTLLECRLETGRTHQIRVHLAAIGHSVVGDGRYGGNRPELPATRPFLHAGRLAFDHPGSGERLEVRSPLPEDLEDLRARAR